MSFRIALSGMNAASSNLDVIANNIANANTTGYKAERSQFADLVTSSGQALSAKSAGGGVVIESIRQHFGQGTTTFTGNSLDLAINGTGFFTLSRDGAELYSRDGAFQVDADGYIVSARGDRLQGFTPNSTGGFNNASLTDIRLDTTDSAPQATTTVTAALNLPSDAVAPTMPFDVTDPDSYNHATAISVFDSLGQAHTASLYFTRAAAPNSWDMNVAIDGVTVGAPSPIVFDNNGLLTTPATGLLNLTGINANPNATPLDLELNLRDLSQYGGGFAVSDLAQDGFAQGRFNGVDVNAEGVLQARYSNGETVALGQIALTNFRNLDGMRREGNNTWTAESSAGSPRRGPPGSADYGLIESSALEASNVDLTAQLVELITAQRSFQANAQVVTTADQITQSVLNLR